ACNEDLPAATKAPFEPNPSPAPAPVEPVGNRDPTSGSPIPEGQGHASSMASGNKRRRCRCLAVDREVAGWLLRHASPCPPGKREPGLVRGPERYLSRLCEWRFACSGARNPGRLARDRPATIRGDRKRLLIRLPGDVRDVDRPAGLRREDGVEAK